MSVNIGGIVFFNQLLEDDEIEPYSGNERFQEDDGQFSNNVGQFTTKKIKNTKDHDISDNIANQTRDEDPTEEISEGGQDEVQTGTKSVKNTVSDPISENSLPFS